jgi:catalase
MVRRRFVPRDGEKQLKEAELNALPDKFLEAALISRMRQGSVHRDVIVTIGEAGDPADDPTILWPHESQGNRKETNRKEIKAGTLTLTSAMPQGAGSYFIDFDPLVLG